MSLIPRIGLVLAFTIGVLGAYPAHAGPSTCGDDVIEFEEECDDGNLVNGDGCDQNCTTTRCGNGVPTSGEECDDGNSADGDGCTSDCELEVCGDGELHASEGCDDGNNVAGDGCGPTCQTEECSNGILDPGEGCDDGNEFLGDGCRPNCTVEVCGDSILDLLEGCDDGNAIPGDGCRADCTAEICGDGLLDPQEECDDGNVRDRDGCSPQCAIGPLCGNGVAQLPEACDDGNSVLGDGCRGDCTLEQCGDGVLDPNEECDDGNTRDVDGCSAVCLVGAICGNGLLQPPELCDDGNTVDGDGCSARCGTEDFLTPSRADQKCVNGINKAWAGVIKTTNKAGARCLKETAGSAATPFADCLRGADLTKAFAKTTKIDVKRCIGQVDPRMFGYFGDTVAVNAAAKNETVSAHLALLGDPAAIAPKTNKSGAACQRDAQKGLIRYLDALAADANSAKKACLKGKRTPQCQTSSALAFAMEQDGKKAPAALSKWEARVSKKCADTTLIASHFSGGCSSAASYAELVDCAHRKARCAFCEALNTADQLEIDCPLYADDSCSLLPAGS